MDARIFFEVMIKNFLELEMSVKKQSGLLSIFKKIDYSDRAAKFKHLNNLALEAKASLPVGDAIRSDANLYTLNSKLLECYTLFSSMTDVQFALNMSLHGKAQGIQYSMNEYTKQLEFFNMTRNSLEMELPKLNSLYSSLIADDDMNSSINVIDKELNADIIDTLIEIYVRLTKDNSEIIKTGLNDMGFEKKHLAEEGKLFIDTMICGMGFDLMALFNLLPENTSEKYYNAVIASYLDNFGDGSEFDEYITSEFATYRSLFEKSKAENEPPFDNVFSKLIENYLGENINEYSIGTIKMIGIMTIMSPIYFGRCKSVLVHFGFVSED